MGLGGQVVRRHFFIWCGHFGWVGYQEKSVHAQEESVHAKLVFGWSFSLGIPFLEDFIKGFIGLSFKFLRPSAA